MASSSHVRCRGQYEGCLGTAERRLSDQLCKNCRRVQEPHRKGSFRGSVRHAVLQQVDPGRAEAEAMGVQVGDMETVLRQTSNGIYASEIEGKLFKYTGMPLDPDLDVVPMLRQDADEIRSWRKRRDAPPAVLVVGSIEHLAKEDLEEIRELRRSGAATAAELQETYHLADGVLEQIDAMDQPHLVVHKLPEGEPLEPAKPRGKHTAEHMEKMRQARARKAAEREAELERARQAATMPRFAWKVTVLQPAEVTVEAASFADALAAVQASHGVTADQVLSISRA